MKGPDLPRGLTVERQVRSIDIMPTILQLSQLPIPAGLDGQSLLPLIDRASEEIGPAISEVDQPAYGPTKKSIREGDKKLILVQGGRDELYNLAQDPAEDTNLIEKERDTAAGLGEQLMAKIDAGKKKNVEVAGAGKLSAPVVMDQATREQLKGLGYLNK